MPEPVVVVHETNAFGEPVKKEEAKIEAPQEEGGDKGVDTVDKDKGGEKLTPTQQIADLSRKLGEYAEKERSWGETQKSKDENIRAMKESLEGLKKQLGDKKVEGEGSPVLFKDIKTSKELTEAEKEDMTDSEIKQFDEIAGLKTALNQLAGMMGKKETKTEEAGIDVNATVRETAKELAGNDKPLANQIIESFNLLKFSTEGLTEEGIAERVKLAAQKVPNYKPPKEQATGAGGKPAGGGDNADPHGVDKVVDEVFKTQKNEGFEL